MLQARMCASKLRLSGVYTPTPVSFHNTPFGVLLFVEDLLDGSQQWSAAGALLKAEHHAGGLGLCLPIFEPLTRPHDDRDVPVLFLDGTGQHETVHDRHLVVRHDESDVLGVDGEKVERLLPVAEHMIRAFEPLHHGHEEPAVLRLVIDDDDTPMLFRHVHLLR